MEIFNYTFFQNAMMGIIIVSIASAIIGTYVVSRRMVFITGGITHASFGGLGLGFFMGWSPIVTAGVFAVASALGVEFLTTRQNIREDSAIGVVWALGMALGTIFIFLTPSYVPQLTSFLFGDILTITGGDLIAFGIYLIILVSFFSLFYRQIVTCAFDRDFARTEGLPVNAINLAMTVLISICVVLTIRLIGIMLLMSLLTLPQMIAETHVKRMLPMMAWSVAVSLVCSILGLFCSYWLSVPASATIVILLVAVFIIARTARAIYRHAIKKEA
jgi:zinc transport system permease protein